MAKLIIILALVLSNLLIPNAFATQKENNRLLFDKLFQEWTSAFNQKDLYGACSLFSKKVVANYQGIPQKNYSTICNGFKKIFREKNRRYHYRYQLNNIYRSDNLAAVRITWFLTIFENDKKISEVQDEGIDILEKNQQDKWQIINYIAFPAKIDE